jgi:hypothetical protein
MKTAFKTVPATSVLGMSTPCRKIHENALSLADLIYLTHLTLLLSVKSPVRLNPSVSDQIRVTFLPACAKKVKPQTQKSPEI